MQLVNNVLHLLKNHVYNMFLFGHPCRVKRFFFFHNNRISSVHRFSSQKRVVAWVDPENFGGGGCSTTLLSSMQYRIHVCEITCVNPSA